MSFGFAVKGYSPQRRGVRRDFVQEDIAINLLCDLGVSAVQLPRLSTPKPKNPKIGAGDILHD